MGGRPLSVLKRRIFIFMRLRAFGEMYNVFGRCKGECIPECHSRAERVIWATSQVAISVCGFTQYKCSSRRPSIESIRGKKQTEGLIKAVSVYNWLARLGCPNYWCGKIWNAEFSSSMFVSHCLFRINSSLFAKAYQTPKLEECKSLLLTLKLINPYCYIL